MPKQTVGVELFYGGSWVDVASLNDVYADTPIVIKRGQSDEGSPLRPCSISCSLANDDDRYRTSNPLSPLYGLAGRNTPARVKVGGVIRGAAEAASWAAQETPDFRVSPPRGKAWVDMDAGGLLARIGQWTEPLRSPYYTYNAAMTGLAGYWPLEDPRGTVAPAFSPVAGARNPFLRGAAFDSQLRPPGSGPLVDVSNGYSQFNFVGGSASAVNGWQYGFTVYLPGLGGTFWTPVNVRLLNGYTISVSFDDSLHNLTILVSGASGATVTTSTVNWDPYVFIYRWINFYLTSTQSGGTVTIGFSWRGVGDDNLTGFSGSYAGSTSNLDIGFMSNMPEGSTLGHVIGTVGVVDDLEFAGRFEAFLGYPGETVADRFARLCTLKNVPYTILGTAAESYPMGPQQVATFADQLKEMMLTEDGLIFDDGDAIALVFMLRNARYNQSVALALVPSDLPARPTENSDDLGVHNIITASQAAGTDYTVQDSTGPLGSQSPPNGFGEARDKVDVNVFSEATDLPQQANWWLRRGTVELPRFPQVTVDLNAKPSLIAAVNAVEVGSVITITGMREYVIRLFVIGWTETIGTHTRTITFTCVPDQQFQAGIWDARRWDLKTSTMNAAAGPGVTAIVLKQTDDEAWSSTSSYNLLISGELVTVTAMGARVGSGPWTQAATVTRAVNGIAKTLPAGAAVHVSAPGRWAL